MKPHPTGVGDLPACDHAIARPRDGDPRLVEGTLCLPHPNNLRSLRLPHHIASPGGGLAIARRRALRALIPRGGGAREYVP